MMEWNLTHTTLELPFLVVEINVRSWQEVGGGILAVTIPTLTATTMQMERAGM